MDATEIAALLRARMVAQANLFTSVTTHGTLIGTGRERALVELLQQIVPRRYELLTGAIASRAGKAAEQVDVIIADTVEFPTLVRVGEIAIVHSASLRVAIEVKSDLDRAEGFPAALTQLGRIRGAIEQGAADVLSVLYCFGAPAKNSTLRDWLGDVLTQRRALATKSDSASALAKTAQGDAKSAAEKEVRDAERALEALRGENLPDLIISDKGAVARAVEVDENEAGEEPDHRVFEFVTVPAGTPTVVVLMEQISVALAEALREPATKAAYLSLISWAVDLPVDTTVAAVDLSGRR